MVHNVEADEMPAAEYTAAVSRMIAVSNAEVKDMARTIAQHRRKMEDEMNNMWDIIQSADRSANPAVKERIKGLEDSLVKVETAGDLLQEAIEQTIKVVYAHLVDQEQINMEAILMKMLTQTIQHSRNREEGADAVPGEAGEVREGQLRPCYHNTADKRLEFELEHLEQLVEGGPIPETPPSSTRTPFLVTSEISSGTSRPT